jgi:NADPH-dependent 2,4-dienoyl-CoA reductase/sulfur reductase-like enzyme
MSRAPLVIVGAGPAGMAAAITAAEAGLKPLVVDENPGAGGQIYRQPPTAFQRGLSLSQSNPTGKGPALLERFHRHRDRIEFLGGTTAWSIFPPRRLAVTDGECSRIIEADHLVLATGAYEYVPPFPGWTLPGVMTPGAAQAMVKTMHVRPGRRALLTGTGPFLLVVAEQLHRAGMEVAGVVEMAPTGEAIRAVSGMFHDPTLLWEGVRLLYRIRRAGIPVHRGHILLEARGAPEVREAVIAPCDRAGRAHRSRARTVEVDTVCTGYGFVPRTQLAQLAGCKLRFSEALGGWIPEVNADLQTSVPGVWVAGDGGGVAGAIVAELQGTLVGLAIACKEGVHDPAAFCARRQAVARRLRRLGRFRAALDWLHRLRPGLVDLASANTLLCRCEDLTRSEIESAFNAGATDLRTLKVMTRLGMGPCQGLMCWPATARFLAARTGRTVEAAGPLSVRPPIVPLQLGNLCPAVPGQSQGGSS